MKKILLLWAVLLITVISVNAQELHVGIKAGAGLAKIDGSSFNNGFKLGYQLGAFVDIEISDVIGVQPELLFNQSNTKTVTSPPATGNILNGDYSASLNYLSIPILLKINASKIFAFNVGPQYSILMQQDQSLTSNASNAFKSGDFSLVLGMQLKLTGKFHVYGRYNIGLSSINDLAAQDKWTNQQIQFGLGLRLF
jgi:hypothetical protein